MGVPLASCSTGTVVRENASISVIGLSSLLRLRRKPTYLVDRPLDNHCQTGMDLGYKPVGFKLGAWKGARRMGVSVALVGYRRVECARRRVIEIAASRRR